MTDLLLKLAAIVLLLGGAGVWNYAAWRLEVRRQGRP